MKTKDFFKRLIGQPTSDEQRRTEKEARREAKRQQKQAEKMAAKEQQRQAEAAKVAAILEAERQVIREYEAEAAKPGFDPRIPHPSINHNQKPTGNYQDYYTRFVSEFLLRYLPSLLEIARYQPGQQDFSMLDYGCGLGRLGFAFSQYFGTRMDRRYFGYEVHPTACEFMQRTYASYPNTRFFGDAIKLEDSYVELQEKADSASHERIDAAQVNLRDRISDKLDLQFSGSVFTHMYRHAIVHVLKEFSALMKPTGVCVNTWLIVDDLAAASLRCGLADRALPYESEKDGFLYYLQDNPLMCTAYRLDALKAIYAEAGHEIIDIRWGKWSGRTPTQDFSWQDAVISRPIRTSV